MAPPKTKSKTSDDAAEAPTVMKDIPRFPSSYRNEASQNTQVLIRDENASSLCVLGPIFPANIPDDFTEVYPVVERDPLLLQHSSLAWSGWGKSTCLRSWPYTVEVEWASWVKRMMKFMLDDWKTMGIRETIELSQFPLEMNSELLAAAACFWSKSFNALILHWQDANQ